MRKVLVGVVFAFAFGIFVIAQQPASTPQTPSNPRLPPLFFSETWKQTGPERDVDNGAKHCWRKRFSADRRKATSTIHNYSGSAIDRHRLEQSLNIFARFTRSL